MAAISVLAAAQNSPTVEYAGGTVPNLKSETVGRLDITDPTFLAFDYAASKLVIPFNKIESYQYTQEVVHHLGVLPAIGVGLLKARRRSHLVRITYRDESNVSQVAVFKVPKHMPQTLLPALQARVPQPSQPCAATRNVKCDPRQAHATLGGP
jgi:hypothetical protein